MGQVAEKEPVDGHDWKTAFQETAKELKEALGLLRDIFNAEEGPGKTDREVYRQVAAILNRNGA